MHFHRQNLAKIYSESLEGKKLLGNTSNGLFLAAPRRTGKTGFLKNDLIPELEARGILVLYVDLWAEKTANPHELILSKIANAFQINLNPVAKKIKNLGEAFGLNEFSVGGFKFNADDIGGAPNGTTICDYLSFLHKKTGKKIALVVDEAQQSLLSEDGMTAMFALKSARDQMKDVNGNNLLLVMSGSDRDKLLRLVNGHNAPFLGCNIKEMPHLQKEFTSFVKNNLSSDELQSQLNDEFFYDVFEKFNFQPEIFIESVTFAEEKFPSNAEYFTKELNILSIEHQKNELLSLNNEFNGMTDIQQAIVIEMLNKGASFKPYDSSAYKFYSSYCNKEIGQGTVSAALEQMRAREEPVIWKSQRGEYALERSLFKNWMDEKKKENEWPPAPPKRISKSPIKKR